MNSGGSLKFSLPEKKVIQIKSTGPQRPDMPISTGAMTSREAENATVMMDSDDINTIMSTLNSITSKWWLKSSWLKNVITIPTVFVLDSVSSLYSFINTIFLAVLPKSYSSAASIGIVSTIAVASSWFLFAPVENITKIIKFIVSLWNGAPLAPPEIPPSIIQKIHAQWLKYTSSNLALIQTVYDVCIEYFNIGYTGLSILGAALVAILTFVIASKISTPKVAMPTIFMNGENPVIGKTEILQVYNPAKTASPRASKKKRF